MVCIWNYNNADTINCLSLLQQLLCWLDKDFIFNIKELNLIISCCAGWKMMKSLFSMIIYDKNKPPFTPVLGKIHSWGFCSFWAQGRFCVWVFWNSEKLPFFSSILEKCYEPWNSYIPSMTSKYHHCRIQEYYFPPCLVSIHQKHLCIRTL